MRSEQTQFDWNRAAQFRALDQLQLPRIAGVSEAAIKLTLRCLNSYGGLDGKAWPVLENLRKRCGFKSERTLRRCLKALAAIGLITTWEERTPEGHKRVGWLIDWPRIFSSEPLTAPQGPGPLATSVSSCPPGQQAGRVVPLGAGIGDDEGPGTIKSPPDMVSSPPDMVSGPPDMVSGHTTYQTKGNEIETSPSGPHRGEEVEEFGHSLTLATVVEAVTWSTIEARLAQVGMNSRSCLRDARKSGVTPAEVGQLIDWWSERREWWDSENAVGVLFVRIKNAYPGQAVGENWRDAVPWRKERWQRSRIESREPTVESPEPAVSRQPTADSLAPWKSRVLELEQQGRKQDLLDLAERAGPFVANWFRKHGITKTTLGPLAKALQESECVS